MRVVASLVMQGRLQAVLLASVLAMLSFMLPPTSILSSAVVALVTLRRGPVYGLTTLLIAGLLCAAVAQLTPGGLMAVVAFVFLMWLPIWLLAVLLRLSRSLAFTLAGALILGLVVLSAQFLQGDDPVAGWQSALEPFVQSLVEAEVVDRADEQELIAVLARWMPGALAAGFFLQSMASLFVARWWQAMLYNPGGFRLRCCQFRLYKSFPH